MEIRNLNYSQIIERVRQEGNLHKDELRFSILRNITVDPMIPYLQFLANELDMKASINCGEYDNILQDVINGKCISSQPDFILVFIFLETLSSKLSLSFPSCSPNEINEEFNFITDFANQVLNEIRKRSDAVILWHLFETPVYPAMGILDYQNREYQFETIARLNHSIQKLVLDTDNAYCVNMELLRSRIGDPGFYDRRSWHLFKVPYSLAGYLEIALEDFKFVRALKGKSKKCIVLDCDNVLWGGVIGEDGIANIKLSKSSPGSAYYEFQQEILNLISRGVIVALCSKNNEEDVWEVFEKHPDMLLKRMQIAAYRINWNNKADNIAELAEELNIGLDSMVFLDDSEFEINLVTHQLPSVETILLPKKKPHQYRTLLSSLGLFDRLEFSKEDQKRSSMYRLETERKKFSMIHTNLDDYYRSLILEAFVNFGEPLTFGRISQLTRKTNQFNLTGKKYSEDDILAMSKSRNHDVLSFELKDRFGEYGIVGAAVLEYINDFQEAFLDTFLLSCRALGRRAEEAFLYSCCEKAKSRGCKILRARYIATKKNRQAKEFYSSHGFLVTAENSMTIDFELNLEQFHPPSLDFYKIHNLWK